MPLNILFVGDPHIQVANIPEVELLIERLINLATEKQPDLIILAGDLLHTHERLHTLALNKAYEMVDSMRLISKTYVLVGNHDYIQNQQFLTENHWMNGMKEWDNCVIVDKVVTETVQGEKLVFVPYVSPGRFEEALGTSSEEWRGASCIFAHQEFAGCKMGAIVSVEGDKWPLDYPDIVSGHIHSRQIPQKNIYYPGAAMQHAFGESEKNVIALLTVQDGSYEKEEIDLRLPRKKIVYMDVEDLEDYEPPATDDKIKVTLSGNYEQFKALKKTRKYKKVIESGVKVVFKPKKVVGADAKQEQGSEDTSFRTILSNLVTAEKDPYVSQAYESIVNGKRTAVDDIIFL